MTMAVQRPQPPTDTAYDAIVVGSGVTGGWAAKELTERGLRTLVIERGRHVEHGQYPTEWLDPWELAHRGRGDRQRYERDYPVQSKNYAFGEATEHFFVNDREHAYDTPDGRPFRWIRGYQLGGRSLIWGRVTWRWSDLDFEANRRDGHGVDWPIRYADLAPWYDHVERFVGVAGDRDGIAHLPDGEFLPGWPMNCAERFVKAGVERAFPDRRMIVTRVANLSRTHLGRGPCRARNQCARGCSFGAYFSSLSATLPAARATGRLTVLTDAIAERVLYDERRDRASGVRVIDAHTGEAREYRARVVFLCASAFNTAKLLLQSATPRFATGLANASGTVGQYLMDHHSKAGARGTVPGLEDRDVFGRRPSGTYVPRFRNLGARDDGRTGFLRGYGLQGGAGRQGWERGAGRAGLGAPLKASLREPGSWRMEYQGYGECLPRAENRLTLDPTRRDRWGLPVLRIDVAWRENELAMRADIQTAAAELLEAAGCRDVETYDNHGPPGFSVHEMGGARMGRDPRTSVLNAFNQAHDVPNLFVTDGACMTSNSCVNPSLTYMALTARAADHAVTLLNRREL
jgi:choline dehydrogenase-like flavoprotein